MWAYVIRSSIDFVANISATFLLIFTMEGLSIYMQAMDNGYPRPKILPIMSSIAWTLANNDYA